MEKEQICLFIETLHNLSLFLNNLLIDHYLLRSNEELSDADIFECPMVAYKKGIIKEEDTFIVESQEIKYVFNEKGVTFHYKKQLISFEYFPVTPQNIKPAFRLLSLFSFIESTGHILTPEDKTSIEAMLYPLEFQGVIAYCYEGLSTYYVL